jgi:hypothetical protein
VLADDIPAKKDKKDNKKIANHDKKGKEEEEKEKEKEKEEKKYNSFKSNNNSFKNDGFRERRQNRYLNEEEVQKVREEYILRDNARKEAEKQEAERQKQKSLTIDNFPELVSNNKEIRVIQKQNYLEKLKKINDVKYENKDVDQDLKKLRPGWALIYKDNLTGKTEIKYGEQNVKEESKISEEEIAINVINALSELHERRTNEYIELNDYDTWERMFKNSDWREREEDSEDNSDYDDETDENEDTEEEYI